MKIFAIEESDVKQLEVTAKRLYTEQRMDGNVMRDLAHALSAIVKRSREMEIPETKKCTKCRSVIADPKLAASEDERCARCGDPDEFES